MKNLFLFKIIILLLYSCQDSFCNKIITYASNINCLDNQICIANFNELYPEAWDAIYIFEGFNTPEDMNDALGFNCECPAIYDHTRLLVFVKDMKVIDKIKSDCLDISFNTPGKSNYIIITKEIPTFFISRPDSLKEEYVFSREF